MTDSDVERRLTIEQHARQLFLLADERKWDELQALIEHLCERRDTEVLLGPYSFLAPDHIPRDSSVLHVVCSDSSVPVSLVELLVAQAPELVTRRDEMGRTPLHLAMDEGGCEPPIIRLLVRAAPQVAQQLDDSYCTPLDILAQMILMQEERSKYVHRESSTIQRQQLESNVARLWDCVQPLAVAITDHPQDWESPLLHACLRASPRGFPYALMDRVCKQDHSAHDDPPWETTDSHGNYPLHVLAGLDPDEDEELLRVARRYPAAAKATNRDGDLPLDIAGRNINRDWDTGIADLLQVYPAPERFSLGVSSYLLARAARQQRTTLLFELLRSRPDFFNGKVGYGTYLPQQQQQYPQKD